MSNQYFGQKYFGKPLPAGAFGGRERPFVQNFGDEVNISQQLNLAQLSSAILKNGEKGGSVWPHIGVDSSVCVSHCLWISPDCRS